MAKEEWLSSRPGVLLSFKKSSAAWATFALLLSGCASSDDPIVLAVYSWWEQEVEKEAFERVIQAHVDRHGTDRVLVRNEPGTSSSTARETLAQSVLFGLPPATFQANVGADVLQWAVFDSSPKADPIATADVESERYIEDLTNIFETEGLDEQFHVELAAALRVGTDPAPYAIPINVHRLNTFYYNVARHAASPNDFLSIAELCPEDKAGSLGVPIAIASNHAFTLTLLTFENVLPALSGAAFYDDLFRGRIGNTPAEVAMLKAEVQRTLECVQYLSRSFQSPSTWYDAVNAVADPDDRSGAAFTVMGDWASGQISAELRDGSVKAIPFPGTDGVFVFTSDSFPLPVEYGHRAEVEELLRTIASKEAQFGFSQDKFSIPARNDVDLTGLEPVQIETAAAFHGEDTQRVLATSGLLPRYFPLDALDQKLRAMVQKDAGPVELEAALDEFVAAVPLLRRWQDRLAAGAADSVTR